MRIFPAVPAIARKVQEDFVSRKLKYSCRRLKCNECVTQQFTVIPRWTPQFKHGQINPTQLIG